MDVYFERIAGVADPRKAAAAEPAPEAASVVPTARGGGLDENGFPVSPLHDQDHLWFVQASRLHRPLASAAATARAFGLWLVVFGGLTALAGALGLAAGGSPVPLVLGAILATLGTLDRGIANCLAAADPGAPGKLARNQIILLVIMGLAAWTSGIGRLAAPDAHALSQLPPDMAAPIQTLTPFLSGGLLLPVIALMALVQGSLALYYMTRRKHVAEFHAELPPWVARVVTTVSGR